MTTTLDLLKALDQAEQMQEVAMGVLAEGTAAMLHAGAGVDEVAVMTWYFDHYMSGGH